MSKISARLQVHATSTTNSVDRLEKAGLVARRSHPDDRRTTLVDLTDAGRELAAQATKALNAEVFSSPDFAGIDLDSLLPHLETLRSGLEAGSLSRPTDRPLNGPSSTGAASARGISWMSK
jgi:DNA-binding MarR family transcriptional regulator